MNELKCVKLANTHPQKCNEEGKKDLATDIVNEMTEEELNKFLSKWGYTR